ncbi:MAG: GYF domain-containing protein [Fimbriimonas sp.]
MSAEWFYIGHYGQLGPLTREQLEELVEGGVVAADTYVWRQNMTDWVPAEKVPELAAIFRRPGMATPPPPPGSPRPNTAPVVPARPAAPTPYGVHHPVFSPVQSDKSRTAGGILQLLIPGIGRIYLGYLAIGVLQLVLSLCGVGLVWSWIDGVVILSGGVKLDGYGRQLNE